jgi:hypothetical protein
MSLPPLSILALPLLLAALGRGPSHPPARVDLAVTALAAPSSPGPTLAREDTMHTSVPEILVSAPRVTLNEILDRVARGEAHRDSMMNDQSFRSTVRMVVNVTGSKPPQLFQETVTQVYKKRPNKVRTVKLRDWRAKPIQKEDDGLNLNFGPSMGESMVNFAFRPSARREFRYRIVGRDLVGDHLVYRIEFEPRSPLDPGTPRGLVWVDTNDFVIVRQEMGFTRSPVPLFLKGIPRMVIERMRVGDYWVMRRALMRAETTIPIPKFGKSFDIAITFDNYAINTGLSDSLFAPSGRRVAQNVGAR